MLNLAAVLFPPFISRGFQFALFIALASVSTTMSASHSDFTKSGIDSFTRFHPFLLSLCFYFSCSPFAFPFFHSRVLLFSNFSTAFFSFVRFLSLLFSFFFFFLLLKQFRPLLRYCFARQIIHTDCKKSQKLLSYCIYIGENADFIIRLRIFYAFRRNFV